MTDRGILILTSFVAITAGSLGYGIGDSTVRYDKASQALVGSDRLQWEVLLTGAAAIFGGWLAYRGATFSVRDKRRAIASRLDYEMGFATKLFLEATSDAPSHTFDSYKGETDKNRMIAVICSETRDGLPEIPDELMNSELYRAHWETRMGLAVLSVHGQQHDFLINEVRYWIKELHRLISLNA